MEENIFDALPDFDRILEQKTFGALTEQERSQVLRFITEENYNRFRESVLLAQQEKNSHTTLLTPDPSVKNRLLQAFAAPPAPPRSGPLSRLLSCRIPLYQAGLAASFLLCIISYLLVQNSHTTSPFMVTDTVYINKPVLLRDTLWLQKPDAPKPVVVKNNHRQHRSAGTALATHSFTENQLTATRMQEAMSRMKIISGLSTNKPVTSEGELMHLVSRPPSLSLIR